MEEEKFVNTGLYITVERLAKADRIAEGRGISRNKLISLLIDSVEEVEVPPLRTKLPTVKNERVLA